MKTTNLINLFLSTAMAISLVACKYELEVTEVNDNVVGQGQWYETDSSLLDKEGKVENNHLLVNVEYLENTGVRSTINENMICAESSPMQCKAELIVETQNLSNREILRQDTLKINIKDLIEMMLVL